MVFCFFWLGLPALIFSCLARDQYSYGDLIGGNSSAGVSKILNIFGFFLGALVWIIVIILFATGLIIGDSING